MNARAASTFVFTRAAPADAEGMAEVFYRGWKSTYPNAEHNILLEDIEFHFRNRFEEDELAKRRANLENPPKGIANFVAKEGERVIGLCRTLCTEERNLVQALYVLSEHQGRGVGTNLLEIAIRSLDRSRDVELWVATFNTKAQTFYRGRGFEMTGRVQHNERLRMRNGSIIPEYQMVRTRKPAS